jgi:hypothetical protein
VFTDYITLMKIAVVLLIKLFWYIRINGFVYHQQKIAPDRNTTRNIDLKIKQVFAI